MAFISAPATRARAARAHATRATRRAGAPLASRRPVRVHAARMSAGTGADGEGEGEVSVPLSSLKDALTPAPAPAKEGTDAEMGEEEQRLEQQDEQDEQDEQDGDDLRTEAQKEADRLRAAEKFVTVDEGVHECPACGYLYEPDKGERMAGVPAGTAFADVGDGFVCPVCRTPKRRFVPKTKVIAGFADNQQYGFGSNTMTADQKTSLIYGGLLLCFLLLLSGYALN